MLIFVNKVCECEQTSTWGIQSMEINYVYPRSSGRGFSIGPYPHILNSFPLQITFSNFKRFCFWLTFSWNTCGWGPRTGTKFSVVEGRRIPVDRALKRKKNSSPVNFQNIKIKCVCNNDVQRCDIYVSIPSICNQLIPIDINLSIDC